MKVTLTGPYRQLVNACIANKVFFRTHPLSHQILEHILNHPGYMDDKLFSTTIKIICKMTDRALLDLLRRNNCIILRPSDVMPP